MTKEEIREYFLKKRKQISPKRRDAAENNMQETLLPKLLSYENVLSFFPTKTEIDVAPINQVLLKSKKLLLPRLSGKEIEVYRMKNLEDIELSSHGIWEPIPLKHSKVDPSKIHAAIVPGVGFDQKKHRIGFGKGYYDRFLQSFNANQITIGVGFKEQLVKDFIPTLSHDVSLHFVELF